MVAGRSSIGCIMVAGRSPKNGVLVVEDHFTTSFRNVVTTSFGVYIMTLQQRHFAQRHHDQNMTFCLLGVECVLNSVNYLHTPKVAPSVEFCPSCLKSHVLAL